MSKFWDDNQPKLIAQSKEGLICFTVVVITIIICATVIIIN